MQANLRDLKTVMRRACPVKLKTPGQIAREARSSVTPFGFAAELNTALTSFERGLDSEEDTAIKLRGLDFTAAQIADVIAARRKRAGRVSS